MCEYFIFQCRDARRGRRDVDAFTETLKFILKISRAHDLLAALPLASAPSTNLPVKVYDSLGYSLFAS